MSMHVFIDMSCFYVRETKHLTFSPLQIDKKCKVHSLYKKYTCMSAYSLVTNPCYLSHMSHPGIKVVQMCQILRSGILSIFMSYSCARDSCYEYSVIITSCKASFVPMSPTSASELLHYCRFLILHESIIP